MQSVAKGDLLKAKDVAALIGVSPRVANDLMRQMPRINIGRSLERPRWAVRVQDVMSWMQTRQDQPFSADQPKRRRVRHQSVTTNLDESGHIPRRK